MVRCDETWLPGSDVPVLLAVVQGAAAEQRPHLDALFADTPWRGPRPPLHVLDSAAWETLQALAASGLLTLHARATRSLLDGEGAAPPPALTREQQDRIAMLRTLARRKARAARALLAADLSEEALPPLREATLAHAQAAAISRHFPEPATLAETARPPHGSIRPTDLSGAISALDATTIDPRTATALAEWLLQAQNAQ